MEMPSRFEKQLEVMNSNIIKLCGIIEQTMEKTAEAFVQQDKAIAKDITSNESKREIMNLVNEIEKDALKIILLQHPFASDLKYITAVLKIVPEIDRVSAQLRDICSIIINLAAQPYQKKPTIIPSMSACAKTMVNNSITSFMRQDMKLAKTVIAADDEVDQLFAKMRQTMIERIRETPNYADQAIYLLMVSKYFEKIGDHAVNIAEWAIFSKTGQKQNQKLI